MSDCNLCGSHEAEELFSAADRLGDPKVRFTIARCSGCGIGRTLPDMTDDELAAVYPNDYWGGEEPTERWIRKSQRAKIGFVRASGLSGGSIVDVGCGAGYFLRALPDTWTKFGVEISPRAADQARKHLDPERILTGGLLDVSDGEASFDAVSFWSALEHVSDPREHVEKAVSLLKPRGTLIVQLPNFGSYQARLFRGDWFALDAPRHRYHFTYERLRSVIEKAGLSVYKTSFRSAEHNAHAFRQSLKTRLWSRSAAGSAAYLVAKAVSTPLDAMLGFFTQGATITVAARKLS